MDNKISKGKGVTTDEKEISNNSKTKSKGRRSYAQKKSRSSEEGSNESKSNQGLSWISENNADTSIQRLFTVPFNFMGGTLINSLGVDSESNFMIPPVMGIQFHPFFGGTAKKTTSGYYTGNDAINFASNAIWAHIRKSNSINTNIEPADFFMFTLAIGQVNMLFSLAKRILRVASTRSSKTRAIPYGMLPAVLGYANTTTTATSVAILTEINTNYANYVQQYNLLAKSFNAFNFPRLYKLEDRWDYLSSNYFYDSADIKGQAIVYFPKSYLSYDETSAKTGTMLRRKPISLGFAAGSATTPLQALLNIISDEIIKLNQAQDITTMLGMADKAFESWDKYNIEMIGDVLEPLVPIYDYDVLLAIQNMDIPPYMAGFASSDVSTAISLIQDTNGYISWGTVTSSTPTPLTAFTSYKSPAQLVPNVSEYVVSDGDEPDPLTFGKLISQRPFFNVTSGVTGTSAPSATSAWTWNVELFASTEIVERVQIWGTIPTSSTYGTGANIKSWLQSNYDPLANYKDFLGLYFTEALYFNNSTRANADRSLEELGAISSFDHHPILYTGRYTYDYTVSGSSYTPKIYNQDRIPTFGAINNWAFIDASKIKKIHETALYYLLNVDKFSSFK